jgi:hypothetical protein
LHRSAISQHASTNPETFDAILGAYETIGEKLTFLSTDDDIFIRHPLLQRILGWVYFDLLEFHVKTQRFFYRGKWKKLFKADWTDFEPRFRAVLERLQRCKDLAEYSVQYPATSNRLSVINLHFMEKLSAHTLERNRHLQEADVAEQKLREEKYAHVMSWLSSSSRVTDDKTQPEQPEQITDHEYFRKVRDRNPGSGDWIVQKEVMSSWIQEDSPRYPVIWLNGIPGAGELTFAFRV